MKTFKSLQLLILLVVFSFVVPDISVRAENDSKTNVNKSWENATVYLPGNSSATTPDKIGGDTQLPVVIYLHGCTGITYESTSWGNYIAGLGYIAILPDSMARRTETNCDPKSKKSGKFPQAHAMRQEEIKYALEQVRKSPWADTKNIFLMGHSEGGTAAARTKHEGFSGIIISGWRCTNTKNPNFDGIFAPFETPILTLEWTRDDWQSEVTKGSCSEKFEKRNKAQQVLFPGSGHNVFDQIAAREAVSLFLKENVKVK